MIDEEIAVRLFSKKFGNLKEKSYEKKRFVCDTETDTEVTREEKEMRSDK